MIPGDELEPNHPYAALLVILALILMALFFSGCSTTRYVPVETTRTDTAYITRLTRDSIHTTDSVLIYIKGDTVIRDRLHTEYVFLTRTDTAYQSRTDTVSVPYPVEARLSVGQRAWAWTGKIAAMLLAAAVAALGVYRILKSIHS